MAAARVGDYIGRQDLTSPSDSYYDIAAGTQLGTYEILSPLGARGRGKKSIARDFRLGREVHAQTLCLVGNGYE